MAVGDGAGGSVRRMGAGGQVDVRTGARWQATWGSACAGRMERGPVRQASVPWPAATSWQRGWKRQPAGMRVGSGGSPVSTIRCGDSGRTDSSAWVYGCCGVRQHLLDRAGLDDPAEVHDRDPVGDVPGQPEVVGDHQRGQAEVVAQPQQQREDLAAHRRVQRGDRLVGDQHLRVQRQRAGDHHALPLTTGQLVRVAQEEPLRRPQSRRATALARPPPPRPAARGSAGPRQPPRRRSAAGSASPSGPAAPAGPAGGTPCRPRPV